MALLVSFLVMLITEPVPPMLSSLIYIGLMPLLGVTGSAAEALSGFSNPLVLFIIASFGIAAAFASTPLPKRILRALLKRFGKSSESILLALMLCTALVSSVLSNVPCCAMFMTIALGLLDMYEDTEDKKRSGRAFMIGVPVATMIGGCITPPGSSVNMLAISMLEQYTGRSISFIQWTVAGLPFAVLALPVSWLLICKIHRPAPISKKTIDSYIARLDIPKKADGMEVRVIIVLAVLLILFILSSWLSGLNIITTALFGCCFMCLPFVKIIKFKDFLSSINWTSVFLTAAVLSVGDAVMKNGISGRLVSLMPVSPMPMTGLIAFASVLTFLLLLLVPVSLPLVTILTPPLIALAASSGFPPESVMLALGCAAGCCFLLPLDVVPLLTYGTGYYSMTDCVKSSLPLQVWLVIIMSLYFPLAALILGWR